MEKFNSFIKILNGKVDNEDHIYDLVEKEFLKKYNVESYEKLVKFLLGHRVYYQRSRKEPEVDCFVRLHAHKMAKSILAQ